MYEAYFGLQRRPFAATPDSDCFIETPSVQQTFADLKRQIETGDGIGILTATLLTQEAVRMALASAAGK